MANEIAKELWTICSDWYKWKCTRCSDAIDDSVFTKVLYKKATEAIDEIKEKVESYLQNEEQLKEHYVYELIDPRNNEVFCEDKGVGHWVEQLEFEEKILLKVTAV